MDDATFRRFAAFAEETLGQPLVASHRQGERRSGGRPAWFMDFGDPRAPTRCYARMARGSEQLVSKTFTIEREYRILLALHEAGILVPEVYGFCADPAGVLMACVPGAFDYTELAGTPEQASVDEDFLRQLAALHALDTAPFEAIGLERPESREEFALGDLAHWERTYGRALRTPVPLVTFACGWLRRNVPAAPPRAALLQGDTGPGQFLFEGGRLTAIIDWEFAHLGDPTLDLAQIRTRDF